MTTIRSWRHRAISLVGAAALVTAGLALATMAKPAPAHASAPAGSGNPGDFFALPAGSRVVDTKAGVGAPKTTVAAGGTIDFSVLGQVGVPSSGVEAVLFNVWAMTPTAHVSFSLFPTGSTFSGVSSLNSPTSSVGSYNASVLSATGDNGKVTFYNGAGVAVNTIIDVEGYYSTSTGTPGHGGYVPLASAQNVVDTRTGHGAAKAKVASGGSLTVNASAAVPSGTTAAYGEIFIANSTGAGFLAQHLVGAADNGVGVIGFNSGDGTSTSEVLQLGALDGKFVFVNHSPGTVDIVVDITGYFSANDQEGSDFHPLQTRLAQNVPLAANASTTVHVAGNNGMPTRGMTLAALNITLTGQTTTGFISVSGVGTGWTANADYSTAGQYHNSLLMVPMPASGGDIKVTNVSTASVGFWVDAEGYYSNDASTAVSLPQTSTPALIQGKSTSGVDAAFIDQYGTVFHGYTSNPTSTSPVWGAIDAANASMTGTPNLAKYSDGLNLQLAVLHAADGEVYTTKQPINGDWTTASFVHTGGIMVGSPVAGNYPASVLVTFGVDADHNLWALTGTQWINLGAADLAGPISAVNLSDGIQIYGLTTGGAVEVAKYNGTLSSWTNLGQTTATGLSVSATGTAGTTRIAATLSDGSVVTELQNSTGSLAASWITVPALTGAPGVTGTAAVGYDAANSKSFVLERLTGGSLVESIETTGGAFGTPVQLGASANTDVAVSPIVGNGSGYRWFGFFIDSVGSEDLIHA